MTEEPANYEVLVYYKPSAGDKWMASLPFSASKMRLAAETGMWETEPGDTLIEFRHPVQHPVTRKRSFTSLGFACVDSPEKLPALGATILLNGVPFVVRECDSNPATIWCAIGEGICEFHLITIQATDTD